MLHSTGSIFGPWQAIHRISQFCRPSGPHVVFLHARHPAPGSPPCSVQTRRVLQRFPWPWLSFVHSHTEPDLVHATLIVTMVKGIVYESSCSSLLIAREDPGGVFAIQTRRRYPIFYVRAREYDGALLLAPEDMKHQWPLLLIDPLEHR